MASPGQLPSASDTLALGFLRSTDSAPRLQRLKALSLFVDLKSSELKIVDGLLHERYYLEDEVIFDEGDEGEAIYIVLEGKVLICRQGQGEEGKIAELGAGSFFGDLALLDNAPRVAQARASEDCTLAVFFRADFMSLLETHAVIASKISLQLAREIARRLRQVVGNRHIDRLA
jgi:CRP-like cAMP-binding protein